MPRSGFSKSASLLGSAPSQESINLSEPWVDREGGREGEKEQEQRGGGGAEAQEERQVMEVSDLESHGRLQWDPLKRGPGFA